MRRVVVSDKHKGNFATKGTISHGGGAISSAPGRAQGDFSFAGSHCGCEAVQGSVREITVKLNKSYYFFFSFCLHFGKLFTQLSLDPKAVWVFNVNLHHSINSISISKQCIKTYTLCYMSI